MPQANCPQCAAPLAFRPGTVVSVCNACGSLCARTDRDPELLGRVAALVDMGSPLAVGATGRFAGRAFSVAGRVQLSHPLGGVWNEWYLALEDGRWGWLAEAQGRFYLTFEQAPHHPLPAFEALEAGRELNLGEDGLWIVQEKSHGTFAGAEGEIPWRVEPQRTYPFADLSGREGAFATLDYGDETPIFYLGREIPFGDLHLQGVDAPPPSRGMKAQSLNCPNCAGPLKLHAPDQAERVACPNCGALLDANQGKFRLLKVLKQPHPRMFIPLGAEGMLRGVKYACIGHVLRSCVVEGIEYPWGEYLLLDPHHGFRWLVESDGHWSFVEPLASGQAPNLGEGTRSFSWNGQSWRRFQDVSAAVKGVWGEFYWKVEQGERAQITEFVAPPQSLSWEVQAHPDGGQEVNASLSTYLDPAEVAAAFKLERLPEPRGVASFQPNPHKKKLGAVMTWMLLGLAALIALVLVQSLTHRAAILWQQDMDLVETFPSLKKVAADPKLRLKVDALRSGAAGGPDTPADPTNGVVDSPVEPVYFSQPIVVEDGHKNLAFTLASPVDNQWIGVEGALVSEETGIAELFEVSSSYYHGVDDGESWSEGSRKDTVYLSAVPAGRYVLRLAPQWDGALPPVRGVHMELRSGVMRWTYIGLVFLALVIGPILAGFQVMAFEGRRWQESMYGTSSSSLDSED
jgi:hypothetical protein